MSTRQYLTDAATRHQVFLQRYGGGQSKEAVKVLMQLRRTINARLLQEPTIFQRERLTAVLRDVEELSQIAFQNITNKTIHGAQQLAHVEANFSKNLFDKATSFQAGFSLPAEAQLITAVMTSNMKVNLNSAVTITDALNNFGKKKTKDIMRIISDGVTLGDTTPVIARNLGNTINTLHRRQLDTLVRTVTNNTSAIARDEVYKSNEDILEGYQWIATLDNRTTMICGSRDGTIYYNPTDPKPPAHWGCRSTTIPIVKPEYDLGADVKGKRPAKGASGTTQVSGRTSYGGWLKKQPREFVDEALGVERSVLFRSGKLKLDKFVDPTGRVYTLEQLELMNPFAFME